MGADGGFMRLLASIPAHHVISRAQLLRENKALRQALISPHHTMVGQWLHDLLGFVETWLPIFFVLILVFVGWVLWKVAGSMPRTKPQNMATKGSSSTTWADVAGVEEVRAELMEVVDFLRDPQRF